MIEETIYICHLCRHNFNIFDESWQGWPGEPPNFIRIQCPNCFEYYTINTKTLAIIEPVSVV